MTTNKYRLPYTQHMSCVVRWIFGMAIRSVKPVLREHYAIYLRKQSIFHTLYCGLQTFKYISLLLKGVFKLLQYSSLLMPDKSSPTHLQPIIQKVWKYLLNGLMVRFFFYSIETKRISVFYILSIIARMDFFA